MLSFSYSTIVGASEREVWSQVGVYVPGEDLLASRGRLLIALRLSSSSGEDLAFLGREFLEKFHDRFYGSRGAKSPTLGYLEKIVREVVDDYSGVDVELVSGVLLSNASSLRVGVLYLAGIGKGEACVYRAGKLYRVFQGKVEADSSKGNQVVVGSGFVEDDDILVLGTSDFFRAVSSEKISKALSVSDSKEASSILAPLVHGIDGSGGMAAVVGSVSREEERLKKVGSRVEDRGLHARSKRFGGRLLVSFKGLLSKLRFRRLGRDRFWLKQEPEVEVRREKNDKRRRLMLSVAFVVLLLLAVSIVFGWRRRMEEQREERFTAVWEVADHQYNEAISLFELNPLRSRALLVEAKAMISEALESPEQFSAKRQGQLGERLEEIKSVLEDVSGEHKIEAAEVFLDLNLVRPDTFGENLALHGETMVVLDQASGVLLKVNVSDKASETVGGGTFLNGSKLASVYAGRGFVLSDAGVVEVSLASKTNAVVVEPGEEWVSIVALDVFGGNLYLLDSGAREIYRYQGVEGGFGSKQEWLGEGEISDISQARDMAINGDIWVLEEDGVLRFRRGVEESFVVSGLDVSFNNPVSIYTDDESDMVYVLDRGNGRVVALDKSGEYREQYTWDGIEGVSDMVVSESQGKIFLLSGSVIYEIELED